MKFLAIADMDPRGSGYGSICVGLSTALAEAGHRVVVIGFEYVGGEHEYPFVVVPSDPRMAGPQARQMIADYRPDAVLVCGDLTLQQKAIELAGLNKPVYAGVFAVEGGPLLNPSPWHAAIKKMDLAYPISQFGAEACHEAGIGGAKHFPVGVDAFWSPGDPEERDGLRKRLGVDQMFVVLSVADNQERKNLPASFEAVSRLRAMHPKVYFCLITKARPQFIGWDLWGLARRFGMERNVFILDQGCSREKLRDFYRLADAYLATPKAEGLCIPVLEAMACGLVCVASKTCSLPYMLEDRGLLIDPEYRFIDPFGNTERVFVSPTHAASQLERLLVDPALRSRLSEAARLYCSGLTWERAARLVVEDVGLKQARKAELLDKLRRAQTQPKVIPIHRPAVQVAAGAAQ